MPELASSFSPLPFSEWATTGRLGDDPDAGYADYLREGFLKAGYAPDEFEEAVRQDHMQAVAKRGGDPNAVYQSKPLDFDTALQGLTDEARSLPQWGLVQSYLDDRSEDKLPAATEAANALTDALRRRKVAAGELPFAKVRKEGELQEGEDPYELIAGDMATQMANPLEALKASARFGGVRLSDAFEAAQLLAPAPGTNGKPRYVAERQDRTTLALSTIAETDPTVAEALDAQALRQSGRLGTLGYNMDRAYSWVTEKLAQSGMMGEEAEAGGEDQQARRLRVQALAEQDEDTLAAALQSSLAASGVLDPGDEPRLDDVKAAAARLADERAMAQGYIPFDAENLGNNIRLQPVGGPVIHPALYANDELFAQALAERPELKNSEKKHLEKSRQGFLARNFDRYDKVLSDSPGQAAAWTLAKQQGYAAKTPKHEILQEFVKDPDNYSALATRAGGIVDSLVDSIGGAIAAIPALMGNEAATGYLLESQAKQSQRRALMEVFGDPAGIWQDVGEAIAPAIVDVGLTALISAGATPLAGGGYLAAKRGAGMTLKGIGKAITSNILRTSDDISAEMVAKRLSVQGMLKTKDAPVTEIIKGFNEIMDHSVTQALGRGIAAGLPAANRAAGATYATLYAAMPDDLTHEQKHDRALGGALTSAAVNFLGTGAFSAIGRGGLEDAFTKGASYRQLKDLYASIANRKLSDATFNEVLKKQVAAGLSTVRKGLLKNTALGMADEALEEGAIEFVDSFVEDAALNQDTPMAERWKRAGHAALVGGILGGGVEAVKLGGDYARSAVAPNAPMSRATRNTLRTVENQFINDLSAKLEGTGSPLTAEAIRQNFARNRREVANMASRSQANYGARQKAVADTAWEEAQGRVAEQPLLLESGGEIAEGQPVFVLHNNGNVRFEGTFVGKKGNLNQIRLANGQIKATDSVVHPAPAPGSRQSTIIAGTSETVSRRERAGGTRVERGMEIVPMSNLMRPEGAPAPKKGKKGKGAATPAPFAQGDVVTYNYTYTPQPTTKGPSEPVTVQRTGTFDSVDENGNAVIRVEGPLVSRYFRRGAELAPLEGYASDVLVELPRPEETPGTVEEVAAAVEATDLAPAVEPAPVAEPSAQQPATPTPQAALMAALEGGYPSGPSGSRRAALAKAVGLNGKAGTAAIRNAAAQALGVSTEGAAKEVEARIVEAAKAQATPEVAPTVEAPAETPPTPEAEPLRAPAVDLNAQIAQQYPNLSEDTRAALAMDAESLYRWLLGRAPIGTTLEINPATDPSQGYSMAVSWAEGNAIRVDPVALYLNAMSVAQNVPPGEAPDLSKGFVNQNLIFAHAEAVMAHEVGHIAGFEALTDEEVADMAKQLKPTDFERVISEYYPDEEGKAQALADLADTETINPNTGLTTAESTKRMLAEEWSRMWTERVTRGYSQEEWSNFLRGNPSRLRIAGKYLGGVFRAMANRMDFKRNYNSTLHAYLNRVSSEMRLLRAGYRLGMPVAGFDANNPAATLELMKVMLRNDNLKAEDLPGGATGDVLRAYAGVNMQMDQFKTDSLQTAQAMAAAGKSSEEIRAVTGWFPGKYDGKMRFEVPDEGAFLKWAWKSATTLGDAITHPAFFAAYPEAKDIKFVVEKGRTDRSGLFDGKTITVGEASRESALSTALHEIQHWIQRKEKFATGGSPLGNSMFGQENVIKGLEEEGKVLWGMVTLARRGVALSNRYADGGLPKIAEQIRGVFPELGQESTEWWLRRNFRNLSYPITLEDAERAFGEQEAELMRESERDTVEEYRRTAGEIESRDVEARRTLTPEQRKAIAPYSSENIAKEDAIVLRSPSSLRHAALEEKHNAGTITPAEVQEAGRLVEERATIAFPKTMVREPMQSSRDRLEDKPLIKVYHGTSGDFDVFERGREGVTDYGWLGVVEGKRHGIFFAEDAEFAKTFAKSKGRVVAAYLNITNPFTLDDAQGIVESRELGSEFSDDYNMARWFSQLRDKWEAFDDEQGKAFVDWLESKGFDGAAIQEEGVGLEGEPTQEVWVALNPSQIKSAENFTGTPLDERFDPQQDSILRAPVAGFEKLPDMVLTPLMEMPGGDPKAPGFRKPGSSFVNTWFGKFFGEKAATKLGQFTQGETDPRWIEYMKERDRFLAVAGGRITDFARNFDAGVKEIYGDDTPDWALIARAAGSDRVKAGGRATITDMDWLQEQDMLLAEALRDNEQDETIDEDDRALNEEKIKQAHEDKLTARREWEWSKLEADRNMALADLAKLPGSATLVETLLTARTKVLAPLKQLITDPIGGEPDLDFSISDEGDIYITKAYKFFQLEGYAEMVKHHPEMEALRKGAAEYMEKSYVHQRALTLIKGGKTRAEAIRLATDELTLSNTGHTVSMGQHMLDKWLEELGGATPQASNTKFDSNFMAVVNNLKTKADMPDPLAQVLGVYNDTETREKMLRTILVVHNMAANQVMLRQMRALGEKEGFMATKDVVTQARAKTPLDPTDPDFNPDVHYDPANFDPAREGRTAYAGWEQWPNRKDNNDLFHGLFAPQEVITSMAAVNEAMTIRPNLNASEQATSALFRASRWLTGVSMGAKTLGSLGFYTRNIVSNAIFFPLIQGLTPLSGYAPGGLSGSASFYSLLGTEAKRQLLRRDSRSEQEIKEELEELTLLGIAGNEMATGIMRDLLKGTVTPKGLIAQVDALTDAPGIKVGKEGFKKLMELAKAASVAVDAFYKFAYYKHEVGVMFEARATATTGDPLLGATDMELKKLAAAKVRMTAQTASETLPLIKSVERSAIGTLFAPFLRFKSEVPRILVNTWRLAQMEYKSGNEVLVRRGRQRIQGLIAASTISTLFPIVAAIAAGMWDEEEEAMRDSVPVYLRNNSFLFWRGKDGGWRSTDWTFVNPVAMFADPLARLLTGIFTGRPAEGGVDFAKALIFDQYLDDQILAGAVNNLRANEDPATGKPIWEANDSVSGAFVKAASFLIGDAFAPMVGKKLVEGWSAIGGDHEGFLDSPAGIVLASMAPTKIHKVDLNQQYSRYLRERKEEYDRVRGQLGRLMSSKPMTEAAIIDLYDDVVRSTRAVNHDMLRKMRGMEGLGLSRNDIYKTMVDNGVSKNRVNLLRQGVMDRPVLSTELMERMRAHSPITAARLKTLQGYIPKANARYIPLE